MSLPARAFSAHVQLPCRVFCGPESILELSGMAVSIDTGSLVLAMPARNGIPEHATHEPCEHPKRGDKVRLELSLPVTEVNAGEKYLALQARVAGVTEMHDGSRQIKFTFRKASFKARVEEALPKAPKPTSKLWRM
jgi:hypothetical protein